MHKLFWKREWCYCGTGGEMEEKCEIAITIKCKKLFLLEGWGPIGNVYVADRDADFAGPKHVYIVDSSLSICIIAHSLTPVLIFNTLPHLFVPSLDTFAFQL